MRPSHYFPVTKALHPAARTPEFKAWKDMLYRCLDPYSPFWPKYGGAGIKVQESWEDFDSFLHDMGRRPEGHVLARKDNDGDFTPENCLWEKREDARRRARVTVILNYLGETLPLAEWAARTGLHAATIRSRLEIHGWTVGQALGLEPRQPLGQRVPHGGTRHSIGRVPEGLLGRRGHAHGDRPVYD